MGLTVKTCVLPVACDTFYFFDKTGSYDVDSNPGGYGTPNPNFNNFDTAILEISPAGYTTPIVLNVFSNNPGEGLPFNNPDFAYKVTAAMCELTSFPQGLCRVTYKITGSFEDADIAYQTTQLVLFVCDYECCVKKKFLEIAKDPKSCCDGCSDARITEALYLRAVLDAAKYATCCGDVASVEKAMEILKNKCSSTSGCKDC